MKRSNTATEIELITRFVFEIYKDSEKTEHFMKEYRKEWKGKNAIEMINSGNKGLVMIYIHSRFF